MFQFAWPWLFLALPLPFLVVALPPVDKSQGAALWMPFADRLARRDATPQLPVRRNWHYALAWLMWGCLLLAATRPQWIGDIEGMPASGRDMMLAVDISGSMETEDMVVNGRDVSRIDAVKTLMSEFIARRAGDRLGLILFGSQAYVQVPLSFDLSTIRTLLNEAELGFAGNGTAIGDAVGLAVKKLQQRPAAGRVLVLLTDGANNAGAVSPMTAAGLARDAGVRIYTIGLGSDASTGVRTILRNQQSDLNEPLLTDIAKITGGRFFRARDTRELSQVYQVLDALEPLEQERKGARPIKEYYHFPLLILAALGVFGWLLHLWGTIGRGVR